MVLWVCLFVLLLIKYYFYLMSFPMCSYHFHNRWKSKLFGISIFCFCFIFTAGKVKRSLFVIKYMSTCLISWCTKIIQHAFLGLNSTNPLGAQVTRLSSSLCNLGMHTTLKFVLLGGNLQDDVNFCSLWSVTGPVGKFSILWKYQFPAALVM